MFEIRVASVYNEKQGGNISKGQASGDLKGE